MREHSLFIKNIEKWLRCPRIPQCILVSKIRVLIPPLNQIIALGMISTFTMWVKFFAIEFLGNDIICGINICFLYQNKGRYRSVMIQIHDKKKNKDLPELSPLTAPPSKTVAFWSLISHPPLFLFTTLQHF